jgi:hypothetical protein
MIIDITTERYQAVVTEIGDLNWSALSREELMAVSCAYYYFSVQFVEAVEIACRLFPSDRDLIELRKGECDTDNLSPYPGVAKEGERMNHDEFMRRIVALSTLDESERATVERLGRSYLAEVRRLDPFTRALSLASYEDGGLETLFRAILTAPDWDESSLGAFRHFLVEHIRLDGDSGGHGSLCRHLVPDDRILPLWEAFRNVLVEAAPRLAAGRTLSSAEQDGGALRTRPMIKPVGQVCRPVISSGARIPPGSAEGCNTPEELDVGVNLRSRHAFIMRPNLKVRADANPAISQWPRGRGG